MAGSEAYKYQRLREEQEKALRDTDHQLQQFDKFRSDYVTLQDRLKTLPNKVTHDVMVPFGSLAFMPGQLVHTNEILVLLGDNYFAERSAKQASDIVTRRLKQLDESTKALHKQRGMLVPRAEFTSDMLQMASEEGEQREIVEQYDEENERQWRERHRESVRHYHEQQGKERVEKDREGKERKTEETEKDYWAILDRLEEQEERRHETEDSTEEHHHDLPQTQAVRETEKDEDSSSLDESEDEREDENSSEMEEEEEEEEEWELSPSRVIKFSHTQLEDEKPSRTANAMKGNNGDTTDLPINSPADLYRFIQSYPKSILKPASSSKSTSALRQDQGKRRSPPSKEQRKRVSFDGGQTQQSEKLKANGDDKRRSSVETSRRLSGTNSNEPRVQAFKDTVVARETPTASIQLPDNPTVASTITSASRATDQNPTSARPVSKFRASRQTAVKCDAVSNDSQKETDLTISGGSGVIERAAGSSNRPMSKFRASRLTQGGGS